MYRAVMFTLWLAAAVGFAVYNFSHRGSQVWGIYGSDKLFGRPIGFEWVCFLVAAWNLWTLLRQAKKNKSELPPQ